MTTIGIDYTPAYEQGGGIGRYVRELTHALAELDNSNQYRLFVAGAKSNQLPVPIANNFHWKPTQISTRWLARLWYRAHIPFPVEQFTGRVDLYHSTDFVLPPTYPNTRTLLTVHDLSYLRTPETASPKLRRYLSQVVPNSIARANHALADSVATQQDLIEIYHVPDDKITVLLSGVNDSFSPVTSAQKLQSVRQKYGIGDRPYIFSIGTVQPRKNYARLVEALSVLREKGHDVSVVIAGGRGWLEDELYHAIDRLNMQDFVHLIGYADDADIPALYSGAVFSSFISLYEGFGLPILESMACGTPVITSNVSSLPEVAGDAAPMVNPENINEAVFIMERLLTDSTYHTQCIQLGFEQIKQFKWEKSAQKLLQVYDELLA